MIYGVDSPGICSDESCMVPFKLPTTYSGLITICPNHICEGLTIDRRSKGCPHYWAGVYRGTTTVDGRLSLPDISEARMRSIILGQIILRAHHQYICQYIPDTVRKENELLGFLGKWGSSSVLQ